MTQAATLATTIAIPRTAGEFPQPPWPPEPGLTAHFTQDVSVPRIVVTGAGTTALTGFSLLPASGAQILRVVLEATDETGAALTAPVRFNLTGNSSGTIWLPIGGGEFSIAAPGTADGVAGLSIVATAPCVVRVECVG